MRQIPTMKEMRMVDINFHPTRCAICDTENNSTELFPANFDSKAFSPAVFSARRMPDLIHYRIARCNTCSLLRSDPIADPAVLANLYSQSSFDYIDEPENIRVTYGRYLSLLNSYGVKKGRLLEIGCGNGFFLKEALKQSYSEVFGVEPSVAGVEKSDITVKQFIIRDIMRPGLFEPENFDVIAMFQVLDHMPDPGLVLQECFRLLKPGGLILCFNHNSEALSAKILGEQSPIIDIEHTYLYSPSTAKLLFKKSGFQVEKVSPAFNRCSLYYIFRLIPFSFRLKKVLTSSRKLFVRLNLWVPLGNMYVIAKKPVKDSVK